MAQLDDKIKARNTQRHSVMHEKSIIMSQTKAKEAEIVELASSVTHLRSNVRFCGSAAARIHHSHRYQQLDRADRLIDTLTDKLQRSNSTARKAEDLEKQTNRYKTAYEQAQRDLEQTIRERNQLQDALQSKAEASAYVEAELRSQLDKLKADREGLANKLAQERADTEERIRHIRAETESQLNDLEGTQVGTLKALEDQIDYLEEEVHKLNQANDELRQAGFREREELTARIEAHQQRIRVRFEGVLSTSEKCV